MCFYLLFYYEIFTISIIYLPKRIKSPTLRFYLSSITPGELGLFTLNQKDFKFEGF